jgi:hypothetical protein
MLAQDGSSSVRSAGQLTSDCKNQAMECFDIMHLLTCAMVQNEEKHRKPIKPEYYY